MHCRIQRSQGPTSSWLTTYDLPPPTFHLKHTTYNLKLPPTTYHRQVGSGKLYYCLELMFLEPDRPSSSPVELPGMNQMNERHENKGMNESSLAQHEILY